MNTGTKIRIFGRLLDSLDAPVWVIGADGNLVYLSAGVATWLDRDVQPMVGRRCVAGATVSDDPLDRIAASLSPPPGLAQRGTASLRVQIPAIDGTPRRDPIEVRFVRIGHGKDAITIAVAGSFDDRGTDGEWKDAVELRQRLDRWRKHHASLTTIATAGVSKSAKRLRRRLQVAAATRTDIGFFGPPGCASELIATRIHQLAAPGEPIVTVDGSLMDPELLDATLMPLIDRLSDSSSAVSTALVRHLDEMPLDAQLRLSDLHSTYGGRLRLLALCGVRPATLPDDHDPISIDPLAIDASHQRGLCDALIEILSSLSVPMEPLSDRVDDIPLLATALLDNRRAAGDGSAERISRAALDALVIYPWPGNFDELDAAIRHAVRATTGSSIAPEHLPLAIRSYRPGGASAVAKSTAVSLDDAVFRYEMRLINEAVDAADGNRAEASRRLGISRSRLLRKLDEAEQRSAGDQSSKVRSSPERSSDTSTAKSPGKRPPKS
ncbi:Transcriptional regulatory protein ZraR [Rubripirellula lacrimiformis]|uniref:Transcriptional regulatory protein ZraR n=1 Tax=Rubripirellula lacrimiformis TaxID=1930273 RepID=A0A517NLP2_9BACT|nr:helix-turn-helix domain-containing protein [Rubripirellula lacrimiformis]QDT08057.1 Transcriptional regulatory protein ZraR [Rubripirellula lacrimiformis]